MTTMSRKAFFSDRHGAVSVLFAGAAVPIIGVIGLAFDFSVLTQARTQMALAADTAALSAVKVGSNDYAGGDTSGWQTIGVQNGQQWYAAQVGAPANTNPQTQIITYALRSGATSAYPVVSLSRNGVAFTSTVSYSGTAPATFAGLFGISTLPIQGSVTVTLSLNAYINIAMLLDNSSSMLIGATSSDINTMQTITPCAPESTNSGQSTSAWTGPTPPNCTTSYTSSSGSPPIAGKPPQTAACGFACHWSNDNQTKNGAPDYTQYDYYALARNPAIGASPNTGATAPNLRFDVVQQATANVISTMETSNVIPNQFGLSVFEFNSSLVQVYPSVGTEASTDLADGETAVKNIVTPVVVNNGDTDFPDSMTTLSTTLTKGGDGSSSTNPRKNLFIVTDGIQDYGSRTVGGTMGPMGTAAAVNACNTIKSMGITIYVLYTPYTPLPYNPFYASNIAQFVNTPPTPNSIVQALQACASSPTDFFEADIPSQVTTGLQTLLQSAVLSAARISS
jgi:Flp pilus assembly protein TadG